MDDIICLWAPVWTQTPVPRSITESGAIIKLRKRRAETQLELFVANT